MKKLAVLVKYGADAVMDLSTGGPIRGTEANDAEEIAVAVGTVPIYEAIVRTVAEKGSIAQMTADDLFDVIEKHAGRCVDFITAHAGLTMKAIERLKNEGKDTGCG